MFSFTATAPSKTGTAGGHVFDSLSMLDMDSSHVCHNILEHLRIGSTKSGSLELPIQTVSKPHH